MNNSERRKLKEEMDGWKSEMDITYREITEVKDQIGELIRQRKYLEDSIRWVGGAMSSAKDSGDREESGAYSRQNLRNHAELSELNSQINQLQETKRQLWERHNDAKDRFRKAREDLRG